MRGVWPGVHPAGKHEAAHADPYQRSALPVPHLLQDLRAEADPQDPHDCTLAREAIQMQGTRPSGPQVGLPHEWPQHDGSSRDPVWAREPWLGETAWALGVGVGGEGSGPTSY